MPGYEDGFPSPGSRVACVTEFRTVAPNVCLFRVRNMAPRILKRLLDFLKNGCNPELKIH